MFRFKQHEAKCLHNAAKACIMGTTGPIAPSRNLWQNPPLCSNAITPVMTNFEFGVLLAAHSANLATVSPSHAITPSAVPLALLQFADGALGKATNIADTNRFAWQLKCTPHSQAAINLRLKAQCTTV